MARSKTKYSAKSTATIRFKVQLWLPADKLRNKMAEARSPFAVAFDGIETLMVNPNG